MHIVTPVLWFNGKVAEAIEFYCSVFKNAEVLHKSYYPEGEVLTASMKIEGQKINFLNGGPKFPLTPAISFMVNCKNQEEVDYYWNALTAGGEESMCGWLIFVTENEVLHIPNNLRNIGIPPRVRYIPNVHNAEKYSIYLADLIVGLLINSIAGNEQIKKSKVKTMYAMAPKPAYHAPA